MEKTSLEIQVEDAAEKAGGILRSRYGLWALGAISFIESALVVPIITDPFLVAYTLADRRSVWRGVAMVTLTSLLGGVFAYALAFSFYEFLANNYLNGQVGEQFYNITERFQDGTFVITILGAVTPVPYTIVAMAAGFVKGNLMVFMIATVLGRFFRYSIVGWLTYKYGQQALKMVRRRMLPVTIICFALAALYFYLKF